jgi:hypothetical protein
MLEEEEGVTEMHFIMSGKWAIAFNSFDNMEAHSISIESIDQKYLGTQDMTKKGIFCAEKTSGFGYIGDYYVLAHKKSEFHYVALTPVQTYALTKIFLFKTLFVKFPEVHMPMLSDSFSRYIREIRKPCGKKRV